MEWEYTRGNEQNFIGVANQSFSMIFLKQKGSMERIGVFECNGVVQGESKKCIDLRDALLKWCFQSSLGGCLESDQMVVQHTALV